MLIDFAESQFSPVNLLLFGQRRCRDGADLNFILEHAVGTPSFVTSYPKVIEVQRKFKYQMLAVLTGSFPFIILMQKCFYKIQTARRAYRTGFNLVCASLFFNAGLQLSLTLLEDEITEIREELIKSRNLEYYRHVITRAQNSRKSTACWLVKQDEDIKHRSWELQMHRRLEMLKNFRS